MNIFKELEKLGYKHYTEHTIEELDDLPLNSEERIMEQALVLRWFREKYRLNGLLNHYPNAKKWDCSVHNLEWSGKELMEYMKTENRSLKYSTYEEAELACLKKLIKIVKQKS